MLAFLLIIPIVLSQTTINNSGRFDGTYDFSSDVDGDIGFFNAGLDPNLVLAQSQSVGLSDARGQPLVANLDNSGLKEIILIDNGDIRLFTRDSNGINIIASVNVGDDLDILSNLIVFDIDGDGRA